MSAPQPGRRAPPVFLLCGMLLTCTAQADDVFLTASGLRSVDEATISRAAEHVFEHVQWASERVTNPLGDLDAMAMALMWLDALEAQPSRVRYRVRLHVPAQDERGHFFLDILRVNHGARILDESANAYGAGNLAPDPSAKLPHRQWRLHTTVVRGAPVLLAAAARDLDAAAAAGERCLGLPCLSGDAAETAPSLQGGRWSEGSSGPITSGAASNAYDSPATPLMDAASRAAGDILPDVASWEPRAGTDWRDPPVAELLLDMQLHGQDDNLEATVCAFDLPDDSVRGRCRQYRTVGSAGQGIEETRQWLSCRRGAPEPDAHGILACP